MRIANDLCIFHDQNRICLFLRDGRGLTCMIASSMVRTRSVYFCVMVLVRLVWLVGSLFFITWLNIVQWTNCSVYLFCHTDSFCLHG